MPKFISKGGNWEEVKVTRKEIKESANPVLEDVKAEDIKEEPINPTHDLNKDGVVDKKDASIAGEVLNAVKKRGRPKKINTTNSNQ